MAAWTNNLQPASFRGIGFEVLSTSDSNGKEVVEHKRAFENGGDLEDMGTQGRQVNISAIFYGQHFDKQLQDLIEALEMPGEGVLVHPILGRMPTMIATSWSIRAEAEQVNYVALDLTFRESSSSTPLIFAFEDELVEQAEELEGITDGYSLSLTDAFALWLDIKLNSNLAIIAALFGVGVAIWQAFKWQKQHKYNHKQYRVVASDIVSDINIGLKAELDTGNQGGLSAKQRFDNMLSTAKQLQQIPDNLVNGKGETPKSGHRLQRITAEQMYPSKLLVNLAVASAATQLTAHLIEHDDDLNAVELAHINNQVRLLIADTLHKLRGVTEQSMYTQNSQLAENLRQMAHVFIALVAAAINQKPPLIVRKAEFDGTVHQFAHEFYADIARAPELIKLNPHMTHPSFIKRCLLYTSPSPRD